MKGRRVFLVDTADTRNLLVRGPIREVLKAYGVPALWSAMNRGWFVRVERVPDLVARLEVDGYVVRRSSR